MNALSWADLTYVLPATSLGYVLLALVAKFLLHEQVSPMRWLGIALITGGVGFIAGGPELTEHPKTAELDDQQLMDVIFTVGAYETLAMAMNSVGLERDADLPLLAPMTASGVDPDDTPETDG